MSQKAGALPSDTPGSQGAGAGSQAHPSPIGDAQQVMEGGTPQAAPAGSTEQKNQAVGSNPANLKIKLPREPQPTTEV